MTEPTATIHELWQLALPLMESLSDRVRQLELLAIISNGCLNKEKDCAPGFVTGAYAAGHMLSCTPAAFDCDAIYKLSYEFGWFMIRIIRDDEGSSFAYDSYQSDGSYRCSAQNFTIEKLALLVALTKTLALGASLESTLSHEVSP